MRRLPAADGREHHDKPLTAAALPVPQTAYELLMQGCGLYGYRDALGSPVGAAPDIDALASASASSTADGFEWLSYSELQAKASYFGSGLVHLGHLQPGAQVGILAPNCPQWVISDAACWCFGLVSVALHAPSSALLTEVMRLCELEVVVCDRSWVPVLLEAISTGECPAIRLIVQTQPLGYDEQILAHEAGVELRDYAFVIAAGRAYPLRHRPPETPGVLASVMFEWTQEEGVRRIDHTQASLCGMALRLRAHPLGGLLREQDVHCSYLPLAYEGERSIVLLSLRLGMSIGFVPPNRFDQLAQALHDLKPTFLTASSRMLQAVSLHLQRIQRSWSLPFKMAYGLALRQKQQEYRTMGHPGYLRQDSWGDVLVFQGLQRVIGVSAFRFILVMGSHCRTLSVNPAVRETVELSMCVPMVQGITAPEYGFVAVSMPSVLRDTNKSGSLASKGPPAAASESMDTHSAPRVNSNSRTSLHRDVRRSLSGSIKAITDRVSGKKLDPHKYSVTLSGMPGL